MDRTPRRTLVRAAAGSLTAAALLLWIADAEVDAGSGPAPCSSQDVTPNVRTTTPTAPVPC